MRTSENDNGTNDFFKIYQSKKEKTEVFKELAGKYNQMQAKIKELIIKRIEILKEVEKCMQKFIKEKAGQNEDPNRIEFLKNINDECEKFNKCYDEVKEESHSYTQLKEEVHKLLGIVNDFVASRISVRENYLKSIKRN